ncbi:MAG TPA: hypothetical protein VFE36_04110 [Candidatus Baltobacteraceae bacterium]|nr:hypothetical protein [Candidatus Baltobacteraceae bacterium]
MMPQPPKPSETHLNEDKLSKELQQFLEALVIFGADNFIKIA